MLTVSINIFLCYRKKKQYRKHLSGDLCAVKKGALYLQ